MTVFNKHYPNMKLLISAFFVCLTLVTSLAQDTAFVPLVPQINNDLYFCRSYTNGEEVGKSAFFIVSTEDTALDITAMVKMEHSIGVSHVLLKVFRTGENDKDVLAYTQDYDIQSTWDYIFFADVIFQRKAGVKGASQSFVYTAVLYDDHGVEIVRNSTPLNVMFMQ